MLPRVLPRSAAAEGFATLSPVAWAMALGGALLLWILRKTPPATPTDSASQPLTRAPAHLVDMPPRVIRPPVQPAIDLNSLISQAAELAPPAPPPVWDLNTLESLPWPLFEQIVEALFQQAGFETGLQSFGGGEGLNIWLYAQRGDAGPVGLVQCKHAGFETIRPDRLWALKDSLDARQVQRGQFATLGVFSAQARAFAQTHRIELLDGPALLQMIGRQSHADQLALLALAQAQPLQAQSADAASLL